MCENAIDYSSAFNTIVPSKLAIKLRDLRLNSALCDWILNFLTGRPQAVRVGNITSSTLILNTRAPSYDLYNMLHCWRSLGPKLIAITTL